MAPSKKQDGTEEAQNEPQIPENSYPFSQKFSPNLLSDVPRGEKETPNSEPATSSMQQDASSTQQDASSTQRNDSSGRQAGSSAVLPTQSTAQASEPTSPGTIMGTDHAGDVPSVASFHIDTASHTDTAAHTDVATDSPAVSPPPQGTLPPVRPRPITPQATIHQADEPATAELPISASPDTLNTLDTPDTPPMGISSTEDPETHEAIPMPASAFSHDDYLTDAEAQAYIHRDEKAPTINEDTEGRVSTANEPEKSNNAEESAIAGQAQTMPSHTVAQDDPAVFAMPESWNYQELDKRQAEETVAEQEGGDDLPLVSKEADNRASGTASEADGDKGNAGPDAESPERVNAATGAEFSSDSRDEADSESDKKASHKTLSKKPQKSRKNPQTGTPSLSFSATHPILSLPPSMPGGMSNAIFSTCSFAPWLFLTLFFVLQTLFTLDVRALWYSDEVRHAAVFTSMLQEGNIFKLELNGQLYPDKPSLYFWFLRGLYEIFQEEGPRLYFAAAAISGLLLLWGTLLLGRLVGRFDGRSLFAGGILLISNCYFMGVTHYARMDLLFSAFILGSYIAFFMAFSRNRAPALMGLAFVFAALACLTKGPLGLLLPLSALVLFAIWCGKVTRFFSADFFIGLIIAVLIVGGWLIGLSTETDLAYIQDQILGKQVLERAVDAFHHKAKWSYYLERLPILLLPWVTIILCLPFHKLASKQALSIIATSRTPEREGQAFLWCIIISALIVLSAISTKILIYLLPALPAMCLVAGRAVLHLSGKRAMLFKALLGFTLLLAGFAIFIATLKVFGSFPLPEFVDKYIPAWQIPTSAGFFIATGILCAAALFLLFGIPSSRPEGVLLTLALMSTALAYPLFGMAAPSLDAILSPRAQGEIIKQYVDEGYHPLTYDMYDGIYTYYAKGTIDEVYSIDEITAVMADHPRVILAIQQRALNKITNMPECFEPIHKQIIEQHEYVLLACPPLPQKQAAETGIVDVESGKRELEERESGDTESSKSDPAGKEHDATASEETKPASAISENAVRNELEKTNTGANSAAPDDARANRSPSGEFPTEESHTGESLTGDARTDGTPDDAPDNAPDSGSDSTFGAPKTNDVEEQDPPENGLGTETLTSPDEGSTPKTDDAAAPKAPEQITPKSDILNQPNSPDKIDTASGANGTPVYQESVKVTD